MSWGLSKAGNIIRQESGLFCTDPHSKGEPQLTSIAQVKLLPGLFLLTSPLGSQRNLFVCFLTGGFRTVRAGVSGPFQGIG